MRVELSFTKQCNKCKWSEGSRSIVGAPVAASRVRWWTPKTVGESLKTGDVQTLQVCPLNIYQLQGETLTLCRRILADTTSIKWSKLVSVVTSHTGFIRGVFKKFVEIRIMEKLCRFWNFRCMQISSTKLYLFRNGFGFLVGGSQGLTECLNQNCESIFISLIMSQSASLH